MELLGLFDKNLPRQGGVIQLLDVQRTQVAMRDVTELRDVKTNSQWIEGEK